MAFVAQINKGFHPNAQDDVYDSIFKEYERVVMTSLMTSFGLDFLIEDQHGGDVDTIHNVRQIGQDQRMTYKTPEAAQAYEARGSYNYREYHADGRFSSVKHEARTRWQEAGQDIRDEYTGGGIGFHGRTQQIPPERKAELDHIIETKAIHEDRGRILSGLNGVDLANAQENLAWTNKSLNASMGAWSKGVNDRYKRQYGCDAPLDMVDVRAYVAAHPDLDEATKQSLIEHYDQARENYDRRINQAYYCSPTFFQNAGKQALKLGVKMGLRQVLGLVFSEIWFSIKDQMHAARSMRKNLFYQIGLGIRLGFNRARERYKELWNRFVEGSVAGALSSLTTTLCNVFFSTAKHTVQIIRQSWASLLEAFKILLLNPDNLLFGDRLRAGAKVLATGASVVAGCLVSEVASKTPLGVLPLGIGSIVTTFCGTLVSGIMSCTLLYHLDRHPLLNKIAALLNEIPTMDRVVGYYRRQCELLEEYSARLMKIDLETLREEMATYRDITGRLSQTKDNGELTDCLYAIYHDLGLPLPWAGYASLEECLSDPNARLTFA